MQQLKTVEWHRIRAICGTEFNRDIHHGHATCDGAREELSPGVCHVCPKGSRHAIFNDGPEDLVLWTVVM